MNLNQAFPPPIIQWVDPKSGLLTPEAYQFLLTLFNRTGGSTGALSGELVPQIPPDDQPTQPQAVFNLTVGVSPFTYAASTVCTLLIIGGAVTGITLIRGGVATILYSTTSKTTNVSTGFIPLSIGDQISITHGSAPTISVIPR